MASKGRPYRVVVFDDFEILIGRGDEENDMLTFEVAAPEDGWLHVAGGVPGSHVVVRNPDKLETLPRDVLRRAAELAAWHSKARGAARVEVHVCRVADVSKRRGAPAGEVMLRRWRAVRVAPTP
jgi:predicted ribosome quality control (RQC) complex YloA/Tae2 family protein